MTHRVFSYGTLRLPEVQHALYGREVPTVADELPGYTLEWVQITDPEVIAKSGLDRHPILRRGGDGPAVVGAFLELTDDELTATDDYEVDDYVRVLVTLSSGMSAWAYVASADAHP